LSASESDEERFPHTAHKHDDIIGAVTHVTRTIETPLIDNQDHHDNAAKTYN
jgi:hypothetical protein